MTSKSSNDDIDPKTVRSFLSVKNLLLAILSIFLAGVGSVVVVTKYLDDRAAEKYFQKTNGQVLEERVHEMEDNFKDQSSKMQVLQQQQNQLLIGVGEIKGKIDSLSYRHDSHDRTTNNNK